MYLRQSTVHVVRFGPCLDKTDGVTEETALTLAQADMRLSKDGGAFAQKSAAGNATHDSDGWYFTTLSTTDVNTVGELRLNVHQPANMLPVWERWWVIEEAIYDLFYGAGATGKVTLAAVVHTGATVPTVTTLTGHTAQTANHTASIADIPTNAEFDVRTLAAASYALEATLGNIQGRIPASLVGGRIDADIGALSTSAVAADNLEASALGIVPTTVNDAAASTTTFVIASSVAVDDHFNGRIIVFTSGVLANQATDITDYVGATKTVTVTALTSAPANGVSFVIV